MTRLPSVLPDAVHPRLHGGPRLRWGILAPGAIAGKFAGALHRHTDHRVHAVGSRSAERAERFAREHGIDRHHGDYRRLVEDTAVDAVYVASPHPQHVELALLAIEAGKHVLVEKPLAPTAAEGRLIRDAARAGGVFAMEAMHTRFHPRTTVIRRLLDDGVLGEITMATAELGVGFPEDHTSRLYDPALAGGAMLDLGVYAVWFVRFALGPPERIHAHGLLTDTGVDAQSVVSLIGPDRRVGSVTTSMYAFLPSQASVNGREGRIHVDSRMPLPGGFTLYDAANRPHLVYGDRTGIELQDGLCRQAVWMAQHVADGLLEAPEHPLDTAIGQLETVDEVRRQLGAVPHR